MFQGRDVLGVRELAALWHPLGAGDQLPTTRGIWSTSLTTDRQGRRRHVGHRIETWARRTRHADGITWFLSKLQAETRADPDSELLWSVPTARSDRAYNWGESAIAPDAVGQMTAEGLRIPFYLEYELRARHPRGVLARLDPYESYYWSPAPKEDQPPFPVTLFVVDTEEGRGGRGHLRSHRCPHEPDVPAHIRVMPARAVQHRDTRTVLASSVGTRLPETCAVRPERLPVGLALPPDASSSCRGRQISPIRRYPPLCCLRDAKWHNRPDFRGLSDTHITPVLATKQG